MRNRKQRDFKKAFALTVPAFRAVISALALPENEFTYSVKCRDGSELHPDSPDEIFALPNPRSRAITRIAISRRRYRSNVALDLDITFEESEFAPVSYGIDGEDADVMRLSRVLEDHLEPMFQKYSLVSVAPWSFALAPIAFSGGAVLISVCAGFLAVKHELTAMVSLSVGLILLLFSAFTERIRKSVFPSGAFCIGDGLARFEKSASIRKQLGLAAFLALVIGIIASVVANLLPLTK